MRISLEFPTRCDLKIRSQRFANFLKGKRGLILELTLPGTYGTKAHFTSDNKAAAAL